MEIMRPLFCCVGSIIEKGVDMRFAFYTDVHLSAQTPRHRVDDYPMSLTAKMQEVYDVAREKGCEFLVCGGDLFNSHRIYSYELLSGVMDIICDSGLDTYLTIGQHDILGYNPQTYKSSTLAFVVSRCNSLKVLWEPAKIGGVKLFASHVWEEPREASQHELEDGKVNILVAHHLLTNKKTMFDTINTGDFARWMLADGAEYDIVLSGDLHDGYEVHEADGIWFVNTGSVARQSLSDIERSPKFAIIDVEPGKIPIIDEREFSSALPANAVFRESAAEIIRNSNEFDPSAFIQGVEDFEVESQDVRELIRRVAISQGLRQEVRNYLAEKSE